MRIRMKKDAILSEIENIDMYSQEFGMNQNPWL